MSNDTILVSSETDGRATCASYSKAVTDQTMRQRAANLGAKIQAEDGVVCAVAVIQNIEKRGAVGQGH